MCLLKYCSKCYFSTGVYSFLLCTVYSTSLHGNRCTLLRIVIDMVCRIVARVSIASMLPIPKFELFRNIKNTNNYLSCTKLHTLPLRNWNVTTTAHVKRDTMTIINQRVCCTVFFPLDHSTPSTSDTACSLTDTLSLSSSDSDLREKGISTGRSRLNMEGSPSALKAPLSETAKEVTF